MPRRAQRIEIGVLWYPGAQVAAVHGLVDLFESARRLAAERGAAGTVLEAQLIRVAGPREVPAAPARRLAALVLPPSLGDGGELLRLRALAAWLAERHREGTILCSVCAGAFLLGATGLLARRRVTTHWGLRARYAAQFPDVRLDTQKILIDDGDIITAGGMMAWVDLGLALIGRYLGPTAMLATARHWVVDPGGREQRFYDCFAPVLTHGDDAILRVQHHLNARCTERVDLEGMARVAKLSPRTFLRRFQRATGRTPTEYLQLLRVERARDRLERASLSFDEIARGVGYEDPGAFRRVFQRVMGLTPGEYRRRFGLHGQRG